MTELEIQVLWFRLQTELADAHEASALAVVTYDEAAQLDAFGRVMRLSDALRDLKMAREIRAMLAACEEAGK